MRVGVFRRAVSFLVDLLPIFAVLSLLFTLFVGEMLKTDDYDAFMEEYNSITEEYNDLVAPYRTQYDEGEITLEEYEEIINPIIEEYNEETLPHVRAMLDYFQKGLIYYIASFTFIYYFYSLFTKGNTFGRKLMKIELQGNINWWTLLLREVIWKTGYYMLTLFVFGIVLDMAFIAFSGKKKAPRDFVTNITVAHQGVTYPF